jgi:hypothetical protein
MYDQKRDITIVVGILLFIFNYAFSWLRLLLGPVPMVLIVAIIIGLMAQNVEDALWMTMAIWIVGTIVGAFMLPFVWSELFPSSNATDIVTIVIGFLMFATILSIRDSLAVVIGTSYTYAPLAFFLLAPFIYGIAFGLSLVMVILRQYQRCKTVPIKKELKLEAPEDREQQVIDPQG